ncbi:hypothetical protein QEH45_gp02 [Microbacterium phage Shocker]|uniref:Uncharacterized protein n=1 Tax=Microbacterium phage Shocker TaxID=2805839 RepID=A0A890URF9_9CAUD|nr:hypothetical protein QEH45_gp02 [Microbacterium phage Shocker]QRI45056.1 hypothetical protein SEA_SHOCKER_2 [Microbacterium phage Shocker]
MNWRYCWALDIYRHPETGIIILGEDMPKELIPDSPPPCDGHCVLP